MSNYISIKWDNFVAEEQQRDLYLKNRAVLLSDPEYVTGVLGVQIPLTEGYPWSLALTEQIVQEQLLFEGFWGDLGDRIKQGAVEKWDQAKALPGEIRDVFIMLYRTSMGKKSDVFRKALVRAGWSAVVEPLAKFLDWVIKFDADHPGKIPDFGRWAKTAREYLGTAATTFFQSTMSEQQLIGRRAFPWKNALRATFALVGLSFIWSYLKDVAEKLMSFTEPAKIWKAIKKWFLAGAGKLLQKALKYFGLTVLTAGAGGAIASVAAAWKTIEGFAKIFGKGASAAATVLLPVVAFYKRRAGLIDRPPAAPSGGPPPPPAAPSGGPPPGRVEDLDEEWFREVQKRAGILLQPT